MTTPEGRLVELGLELPPPNPTAGNYVPAKRHGDLVFLAGHGTIFGPDGTTVVTGKVGAGVTLEQAREAARLTGLLLLTSLRGAIGSLDNVSSIIKVLGMVNCAPGFNQTPTVIDGCSDLLVAVFGEDIGRHARSAVGMAELPFDIPVEIEMVVAVSDGSGG